MVNQDLRQFMNIINESIETVEPLKENYFKDMDIEIQDVVQEAENAFWEVVSNWAKTTHPEITTGDFPPDAAMGLQQAMTEAVQVWISGNQPSDENKWNPIYNNDPLDNQEDV